MNPVRAQADWPPAVVGGLFQTGVQLMKHLRQRGVEVCAFDSNPNEPGFRTRYGRVFHCPNPDQQPEQWLAFMVDLARQIGRRPVFIPTGDLFVTSGARFADALRAHYFITPSIELQDEIGTKDSQYDIAARHGLPTPNSQFIDSMESLQRFMATARFPCLLKPSSARHWAGVPRGHILRFQKVVVADTPAQLSEYYKIASALDRRVIAQEVIVGPDTAKLVYLSCYDRSGRRLGSCILRQVRTDPKDYGSASVVEPIEAPDVDALSDAFLKSLHYTGICELELKRDSRDGQVKLIEINPRYSATADAGLYAGVNVGWLHYLDLIGKDVEPVQPSSRNFRHIMLHRDLPTLSSYRKAGLLPLKELLRTYRPPVYFFDFDLFDWKVTARTILGIGWRIFGRPWMRRFIPKRRW